MENTIKFSISHFSVHLFWDTDPNLLDFDTHKEFIIQRVMEYGLMQDWEIIKQVYGLEKIKEVALQLRYLDDISVSFLATLFNLDKQQFRCYKNKQSNPHYWNF